MHYHKAAMLDDETLRAILLAREFARWQRATRPVDGWGARAARALADLLADVRGR